MVSRNLLMVSARNIGIALAAAACLAIAVPQTVFATVEGDQTPLSQEEIDAAIAAGEVADESVFANEPALMSNSTYAVTTVYGDDRYETSAQEALSAFSSSQYAIIANGMDEGYADSIGAAGLAGALDCPVLLTESNVLPPTVRDALVQLGVKHVLLIGEEGVTSSKVMSDLQSVVGADGSVIRLGGIDRYATQMKIYEYGAKNNLWTGEYAVVTTGVDFPDSLSASPLSFKLKAPVFFCDVSKALPSAQRDALVASGKTKFLLIGETGVTSLECQNFLASYGSVVRLGGATRYDTSRAINNYAVTNLGFTWNDAAIASGETPYDALGGGVAQGKLGSVLALMHENQNTDSPQSPFGAKPSSFKFYGGRGVFSMAYKTKVARACGFHLTDIEGFRVYIDAGHGQDSNGNGTYDPGASSGSYVEAQLTSDLASRVASQLRARGINAYVNTDGWYKLRQAEANNLDCGYLVSLHFNAGGGTGSESYIHSYNAASGSWTFQRTVHPALVNAMGLRDRGMYAEAFAVCGGNVPATLLEICFIDNANDMSRYMSRRDQVAANIADAIATL